MAALAAGSAAGCAPLFGRPRTFTYAPERNLQLDVYPTPAPNGIAAVLVHGGAWQTGDRRSRFGRHAHHLAARGITPIAIDYRLTLDGARWPAPAQDVQAAIRWVRAHAGELGVDPAHLYAIGESAGGHLSAWCAVAADDPSGRPDALAALYAPWDLSVPRSAWQPRIDAAIDLLMGDQDRADASPLLRISANTPPTLLIHSHNDDVVPFAQSEAAHGALTAAGVESQFIAWNGIDHGWSGPGVAARMMAQAGDFAAKIWPHRFQT